MGNWRKRIERFARNAEVIFDQEEPLGRPTDMVLPDRRWFRRKSPRPFSRSSLISPLSK